MQGVPIFIIEKTMAKMLNLPKSSIANLPTKPIKKKDKEREREKKVAIYQKIASLEAFIDQEGWKVSFLKGMYATITRINPSNMVEGQSTYLCGEKFDEFCNLGQVEGLR
jgi:hypothetical protein